MWNSFWIYSLFSTVKPYARIKMFVGFILNTFLNSADWKYFWRDCTSTRLTLIENFVTSNCIWNRKYQHTSQVYASKAFDKQRHPPSRYYHVKKLYWLTDLIAAVFPLLLSVSTRRRISKRPPCHHLDAKGGRGVGMHIVDP